MLTLRRLAQVCRVESRWLAGGKQHDKMEHIHRFAQFINLTLCFPLNTVV